MSSSKFTELERRDVAEIFRVHDFSKVSRVDEAITAARERGLSAAAYFDELYTQYRISQLPDRAAVLERMATASPDSTLGERLAAVRRAEVRGHNGADATLDLKREVKHRLAEEAASGTAHPSHAPEASNPLQEAIRKLRHVDPTSADAIATAAAEDATTRKSGSASIDVSHRQDVKSLIGNLEHSASSEPVQPPAEGAVREQPKEDTSIPEAVSVPSDATAPNPTPTPPAAAPAVPAPAPPTAPHDVELDRGPIDGSTRAAKLSSAPSKAAMDGIIEADVREWLEKVLGDAFNGALKSSTHLVDSLRDGVALTVLLQKLQDPPTPDAEVRVPKRTTGFFARDSVAQFLIQARKQFGLVDAQLFTDSDLCDGKDDRQVVTCLMAIARLAYQRGVTKEAPSLIVCEKEIEQSAAAKMTNEELSRIVEAARAADEDASLHDDDEHLPCAEPASSEDAPAESAVPGDDHAEAGRDEAAETSEAEAAVAREEAEAAAAPDESVPEVAQEEETPVNKEDEEEIVEDVTEGGEEVTPEPPAESDKPDVAEAPETTPCAAPVATHSSLSKSAAAARKGPLVVHKAEPAQKPLRYFARHWDYVDVALGNVVNEHYATHPDSPWRFRAFAAKGGEYVLYSTKDTRTKRLLFVRIIQKSIVVRQSQAPGGPVWMPLKEFVAQLEDETASP